VAIFPTAEEDTVKKCCVALMLLGSTSAFAAEPDRTKFIEFSGTTIDGHTARPATMYMEGRTKPVWEKLLSLKKSMRDALSASVRDPNLR
jgi:hypothetical protein